MAQAKFVRGNPEFARYKPGSAVAAGDVVIVGDVVGIAHSAIAANQWGNLAVGGGIYEVTSGAAIAVGAKVGWDTATGKLFPSANAAVDKICGFLALHKAATAADQLVEFIHRPGASS